MAPKPRLPDLPKDDDGAAPALPPDDEPPGDGLPSLPELSEDDGLVLPELPPVDGGNPTCPFNCAYKKCACLSITPQQKEVYATGEQAAQQQGDLRNFRFHYVRSQMVHHEFDQHYRFEGEHVCARALCSLMNISDRRFRHFKAMVKSGALSCPDKDERSAPDRGPRDCPKCMHVVAWLEWCYFTIAEPLAEQLDAKTENTNDGYEAALLSEVNPTRMDHKIKHMPCMTQRELFDLYALYVGEEADAASRQTFAKAFHQFGKLAFRRESQHARCTVCGNLSKRKRDAETLHDKQKAAEHRASHLRVVFADKAHEARLYRFGTDSTRSIISHKVFGENALLTVYIDGFDQAKCRLPRNVELTKQTEGLWRPHAHVLLLYCCWSRRILFSDSS